MKYVLIALSIIMTQAGILSAVMAPLGHVSQSKKEQIAKRFAYFAHSHNEDSAKCCLLDFARILKGDSRITLGLIELSKTSSPEAIIETFAPYFDRLPASMQSRINTLAAQGKLITLLNKRIASNGQVSCATIPQQ